MGRAIGSVAGFFTSPLASGYPSIMKNSGDWLASAGAVLFIVAVFGLSWIRIRISAFGSEIAQADYGLFVSPWAWGMVVVLVAIVAGLWFVQTRGVILIGAGIYCLLFNVIFFIGAWHKINAIIGDIVGLARSVPFVGSLLGQIVTEITKRVLDVNLLIGFYLFIPAGVLLLAGGCVRLASASKERNGEALSTG